MTMPQLMAGSRALLYKPRKAGWGGRGRSQESEPVSIVDKGKGDDLGGSPWNAVGLGIRNVFTGRN